MGANGILLFVSMNYSTKPVGTIIDMVKNRKKILIVEDELPMLQELTRAFTNAGFETFGAKNGEEGLAVAIEKNPDMILLDLVMPKMDGMTMLKKLRQNVHGENIPVIVLTNLNDSKAVAALFENGVREYLVKSDWDVEELIKKVNKKLGT